MRVLIADDHPPTLAAIREALEQAPHMEVCAAATDAPSAIREAVDTRPDICLLDLMMPGGGLGAIREITSRLPTTRVVVLTVSDREDDFFAALRQGAVGFLSKDASFRELPAALEATMRGEAPIPPALVARMVEQFRGSEPRWRAIETNGATTLGLTAREWQVLEYMDRGLSTAQIGEALGIAPASVRVHIHGIVKKLEAGSREEALERFRAMGGTAPS